MQKWVKKETFPVRATMALEPCLNIAYAYRRRGKKKGEKIKEKRYKHKEPPLLIENELNIYGLQYSERGIWWVSGRFSEAQKRWRTLLPCGCFFSLSHIGVQVTTSAAACDPI